MRFFFTLCIVLPSFLLVAQKENYGVIVQYEGRDINTLLSHLNSERAGNVSCKSLSKTSNIYLLQSEDAVYLYESCKRVPEVLALEYNQKLEKRLKPNDSRIGEQYCMNLIKAYEVWDITTGGKDVKGNDIVIGVIDDGYDIEHEDLNENVYINPDEIAGDGKDNDGNGYIDDVKGWNTRTNTGVHDVKSHGTYILGAMGAKGNNQKGISGVNWNIKLIPVTTGNLVSDVIEGYEYLLAERKQYNTSGGTKGSNILISSYSGGISKAFAADYPVWCAVYNKLGEEGILSISATTNDNDNVEVVGDMPSTCTSPYLLVVNSTNKADEKDASTGYGNISVDISAPGDRILTTEVTTKGLYKLESGTSLSTPIVAGAAALLYSINCELFYTVVRNTPSEAAMEIKDVLMASVDLKTSLTGKTVSEGRLNIYNAIKLLEQRYDTCISLPSPSGAVKINYVHLNGSILKVDYISADLENLTLVLYDNLGRTIYKTNFNAPVLGHKEYFLQNIPDVPGIYYVSLITASQSASKAFLID